MRKMATRRNPSFWGLSYQNKSQDHKGTDPETPMNKIYAKDLVHPEIKLIAICKGMKI